MAPARQTELERTWPLGVYHVPLWLAAVLLLAAVRVLSLLPPCALHKDPLKPAVLCRCSTAAAPRGPQSRTLQVLAALKQPSVPLHFFSSSAYAFHRLGATPGRARVRPCQPLARVLAPCRCGGEAGRGSDERRGTSARTAVWPQNYLLPPGRAGHGRRSAAGHKPGSHAGALCHSNN